MSGLNDKDCKTGIAQKSQLQLSLFKQKSVTWTLNALPLYFFQFGHVAVEIFAARFQKQHFRKKQAPFDYKQPNNESVIFVIIAQRVCNENISTIVFRVLIIVQRSFVQQQARSSGVYRAKNLFYLILQQTTVYEKQIVF